jgi:hypothetical protein
MGVNQDQWGHRGCPEGTDAHLTASVLPSCGGAAHGSAPNERPDPTKGRGFERLPSTIDVLLPCADYFDGCYRGRLSPKQLV